MRSRLPPFALLLTVLLLAAVGPCATAQTAAQLQRLQDPRHYDATRSGEVVDLGPLWLFQEGDDPAWAAKDFDDSKWQTINTNKSLVSQGHPHPNQVWFRVHMHVRPDSGPLVLGITTFFGSYEIFVNGVRIGGEGKMSGRGEYRFGRLILYGIPKEAVRSGELTIALHGAVAAAAYATESSGGFTAGRIMVGGPIALAPLTFESYIRGSWIDWVNLVLVSFVVFVVLALYRALPEQKEYLAIALCGGLQLISVLVTFLTLRLRLPFSGVAHGIGLFANAGFLALQVEVVLRLVGLRPARWIRALQGVLIFTAVLEELGFAGITPVWIQHTVTSPALMVLYLALPVYLFRELRRGNPDAPVLFAFQIVWSAIELVNEAGYYLIRAHLVVTNQYRSLTVFDVGQFTIGASQIATIYFWVTLLVIIVLRTVRLAREKAEITAEVEAARTVQQMLIPAVPPVTPGFAVESVYLPARQVGGDFFLVTPPGDGSLLIVTGDVSGKGLQAAMVVSTILGALRNETSRSPATVLANLNQVLLGQVRGFVTCTAALIAPDGRIALANAGNPAPYLNGRELAISSGLPLGMIAGIRYEETAGQLSPGDLLTFVSDGVVEATAPATRELFGFDRTQAISTQAANAIAEAARVFGRGAPPAADMTVLTGARPAA